MGLFSRKKKKQADYQAYLDYQHDSTKAVKPFRDEILVEEEPAFDDSDLRQSQGSLDRKFLDRAQEDSASYDVLSSDYSIEEENRLYSNNLYDPLDEDSMDFVQEEVASPYQQAEGSSSSIEPFQQPSPPKIDSEPLDNMQESIIKGRRRAKYSAKIDRFLNNGIIIVGVLLALVLLIAFLA